MKKVVLFIILLIGFKGLVLAQNPVSYPKDTALSKPELNFEVLWQTFEDNYAFFRLRNIDWNKEYREYRPRINANTSDDSLYSLFTQMLAPFNDNHVNVIVPRIKQFKAAKPSQYLQEFPTDSLQHAFWNMVDATLARKGFGNLQSIGPLFDGKPLFRFAMSEEYGYLRFNRCFADQSADNKPDAVVAGKILDTLFANFRHLKGMIIDVRDNIGGNDEFAYEVAGRFTDKKIVGMYKETRKRGGGYDEYENKETWYLEPTGMSPFMHPVTVLTNDKTASAGDVFAMIIKELPQVKIIGTNTRGIYSDMYGFTLPNGWLISLSNQVYYNNRMVCCEGPGTPVDIEVKNTRQDLGKMTDPVVSRALVELKKW